MDRDTQGQGEMPGQEPMGQEGPDVRAAAETVSGETRDAARTVAQTAREQAGRVSNVVRDQTAQIASQAAGTLRSQADQAKTGLAHTLDQAAVRVRETANQYNRGELGMKLAQPLERSADYLRETPVENLPADLNRVIARNPLQSAGVAFGLGLLFGMLMRRR